MWGGENEKDRLVAFTSDMCAVKPFFLATFWKTGRNRPLKKISTVGTVFYMPISLSPPFLNTRILWTDEDKALWKRSAVHSGSRSNAFIWLFMLFILGTFRATHSSRSHKSKQCKDLTHVAGHSTAVTSFSDDMYAWNIRRLISSSKQQQTSHDPVSEMLSQHTVALSE